MVPTYHSLTRLKPAEKRESRYLGDEYQNFLIYIALIITGDEGGRWNPSPRWEPSFTDIDYTIFPDSTFL